MNVRNYKQIVAGSRNVLYTANAPINVNPVGGGGVRVRGGDLTKK